MTSSSLNFGPEWMRKAAAVPQPNKSSQQSPQGQSSSQQQQQHQQQPPQARRNPSLGAMGGPAPVLSPSAVPSPGGFSFAAAAAGSKDKANQGLGSPGPGTGTGGPTSGNGGLSRGASGSAADKEAALRYARDQSLSLYSSKGTLSPTTEAHQPLAGASGGSASGPAAGEGLASGQARRKHNSSEHRDPQKRQTSSELASGGNQQANAEPRGLNARGSSSTERSDRDRPGLFQRASSSSFNKNETLNGAVSNPAPASARERFSGIQGGVLSGVAPPEQRRRKESENMRLGKHAWQPSPTTGGSAGAEDSPASYERKSGNTLQSPSANEAFASTARLSRGRGTSAHDAQGSESGDAALKPSGTAGGAMAGADSWIGRRRERTNTAGETGPSGPIDGAAGFGKFAGYDRKRERTGGANAESWRTPAPTRGQEQTFETNDSVDPDQASQVHKEMADLRLAVDAGEAMPTEQRTERLPSWTPDSQQWLYQDPTGQMQGPFTASVMQSWYEGNYFTPDLMMRPEQSSRLFPLAAYAAAVGQNPKLFLLPPPNLESIAPPPSAPAQQQALPSAAFDSPQQNFQQPDPGSMYRNEDQARQERWARQPEQADWLARQFGSTSSFGMDQSHFGQGGFGSPHSPFAPSGHNVFGQQTPRLDARLQQQEEYLSMLRHRGADEQIQRQMQSQMHGGQGFFGQMATGAPYQEPWAQQQQQQQQQQQAPQADRPSAADSPWSSAIDRQQSWTSPVPSHVQANQQQQESYGTIGTPIRSRSPAPEANESTVQPVEEAKVPEQPVHKEAEPEVSAAEPEPAEPEVQEPPRPETPQPQDPAPEQDWPQSPSAVEFASEPDFGQAINQQTPAEGGATHGNKRVPQGATAPGRAGTRTASTAGKTVAGGNVKVVGADQFPKGSAESETTGVEAPLSSLMPNGNASATPATGAKPAPWAQQPEESNTSTGNLNALSLREIQEMEAKQAEARRAAEKAAQRRNAAAAGRPLVGNASDSSANMPTTMSWGLASIPSTANKSQPSVSAAENGGTNNSSTPGAPPTGSAWSTATGPTPSVSKPGAPKKTLMEIQEEERKRVALQQRKAAKAFADSVTAAPQNLRAQRDLAASNAAASAASTPAPGWSVVGAGGKPAPPAPSSSAASTRPAPGIATRTASTTSIPSAPGTGSAAPWASNGATTTSKPLAAPAATAAAGRSGRPISAAMVSNPSSSGPQQQARDPSSPSPEFLRYCREQLAGLKGGVKVDDFLEMLLSFPLDPSPDVVEIIAESIYANSSTLDGRRLANDFVAKRKLDAGIGAGKGGTGAQGRTAFATVNGLSSSAGGAPGSLMGQNAGRSAPSSALSAAAAGASSSAPQHGFQQVVKKGGKKKSSHA